MRLSKKGVRRLKHTKIPRRDERRKRKNFKRLGKEVKKSMTGINIRRVIHEEIIKTEGVIIGGGHAPCNQGKLELDCIKV